MADRFNSYAKEHENARGAGDDRPTALQIIKDQNLVGEMTGKVFLVTGGTGGIGLETCRALGETGADVYFTARTQEKGQKALQDMQSTAGGSGILDFVVMELESLDSVKQGAAEFLQKSRKLNGYIANAGVSNLPAGTTTKDGVEVQFGVNHLAHFLLFQLLKPALLASSSPEFNSRFVSVSSAAHSFSEVHFDDLHLKKFDPEVVGRLSYGQSKTANIYMANEIDRRYGDKGLHGWSLHPGGILTGIQRHLDPGFIEQVLAMPGVLESFKSLEQGAATTVWAAVGRELEGWGGKYLEDVTIAPPRKPNAALQDPGYEAWCYDEAAEKRLWALSLEMIGFENDTI